MRRLLNKPWVVAFLAVAAVFFVVQSLREQRPRSRPAAAQSEDHVGDAPDDSAVAAESAGLAGSSLVEALKSLALGDTLPDPFEPRRVRNQDTIAGLPRLPDHVETLHLSAIWRQEGQQLAHVNGHIAHPGDTIGRITLGDFERDGIWLTHWKGRDFLRLGQEFTLITPAANAATLETVEDER